MKTMNKPIKKGFLKNLFTWLAGHISLGKHYVKIETRKLIIQITRKDLLS